MNKTRIGMFAIVFFLLVGTVFASIPKDFKDIEVSVDIRQVKGDDLEVWWEIENKGNIKTTAEVVYGYSRYDYDKEKWVPLFERELKEDFAAGSEIATGGIPIEFGPGYYMLWIRQTTSDKIKENNEAKVFYTIN